jgi:hypothetical protein
MPEDLHQIPGKVSSQPVKLLRHPLLIRENRKELSGCGRNHAIDKGKSPSSVQHSSFPSF